MKKQNIEDIFSSMENFSSVPPPELWNNIEEKLHQPKKKKAAVIWWSIAASLLVGLFIPSVLYFNSGNEIQNSNNRHLNNNGVVLEENKNDLDKNKTRTTNPEEIITIKESKGDNATPLKDKLNISAKNQKQEIQTADSNSKNKIHNNILDSKSDAQKSNTNHQAVAEKSFVPHRGNRFNTALENQNIDNKKRNTNYITAEKTFVSTQQNTFNNLAENQNTGNNKRNTNQITAEKTVVTTQQNTFNNLAENKNTGNNKRNTNQITAEKTVVTTQQNTFNNLAENQNIGNNKRNNNQAAAEQKVVFGKKNQFNPTLKNQVSNSVFEDKTISENSNNVAYNFLNSTSNRQNLIDKNKAKQTNENPESEKAIASTQKNTGNFNNTALSKLDSVQLAELQNLEKGIITPETKDEKEKKSNIIKDGKWAVSVFAGVASSENYKNGKTLGNVNDSKQASTYGVKTKYKINKKWAVGSGFKINELGQSVTDVSYMSVKNNAFFTSGDYYLTQNSPTPQIAESSDYVLISNNTKDVVKSDNIKSGNLDQNLRYIEMPFEVSYSLFNKNKASINLNTGGFVGRLISNNVTLDGTAIGENVNANDFVYGSTLSSTLQYRVYKKTNVFVEPAVNYYINPLNSQSFNQFQWGLNFGLNVSF